MNPRLTAALVLLCLPLAACQRDPAPADAAQPPAPAEGAAATPATPPPPNETPAGQRIEADVRALADDAMEGRRTGTPGFDRAAEYVAKRFGETGLAPAGDDGSWFQAVPLLQATVQPEGARLEIVRNGATIALEPRKQFLPLANFNAAEAALDAPAVFVGQAVHAPDLGHDDFAGLDLDGRIAVMFGGAPARFEATQRAFHASTREKLRNVVERGAVGVVYVNTADDEVRNPWARSVQNASQPSMRLRGEDGGAIDTWPQLRASAVVSATAADELFAGGDRSAAQLFEAARAGQLRGFPLPGTLRLAARTRIEPLASRNVVGRLPGADPALAGEHVVYTAHLDHIGTGEPVTDAQGREDRIRNGAIDNALGVAILLEAARELEAGPRPKRSMAFVALTAEEQGLLGAEWFANRPSVDGDVVANINMDMPMLTAPTTDVVPIGVDHSSLGAVLDTAAAEIGVTLSPDPFPEETVFVRSDQYAFVRAGIPAVYLMGGVVGANPDQDPQVAATWFLRNCYHQPCDQVDLPIQYGDAARLATLNARIGRITGDAAQRPRWNDGDFFGERFGKPDPQ
ncbi:M20/M25/M40 family metallo-hydrolase [Luteimonas kalidii]|uniref:M20/M25/M40 family metallo-hydrolase n=1 Tax=Luteimonas kalidii TaxID=3042025 RepID=A0ABT6JRI5_9GAMM|nr:M20/M25/M40 family metallo-hydrolase [Luteimonas kalidii]MDH5833298.1 M20/M25/M40 family metallo-hydrolase [Luteimonas kalidii]